MGQVVLPLTLIDPLVPFKPAQLWVVISLFQLINSSINSQAPCVFLDSQHSTEPPNISANITTIMNHQQNQQLPWCDEEGSVDCAMKIMAEGAAVDGAPVRFPFPKMTGYQETSSWNWAWWSQSQAFDHGKWCSRSQLELICVLAKYFVDYWSTILIL